MGTMKTYKTGNLSITASQADSEYIEDLCADIEVADRIKGAVMHSPDNTPAQAMQAIASEREHINDRVIFLLARYNHEDLQVYKKTVNSQRARNAAKAPRGQQWRSKLAKQLVSKFETFADAWRYLESGHSKYEVIDECLHYYGNDCPNATPIKKESFRTGYWVKHNKQK